MPPAEAAANRNVGLDRVLVLKASPLLAALDPDQLTAIALRSRPQRVAPGATLSAPGEPIEQVQLIVSGRFRVSRSGRSGERLRAGALFGGVEALAGGGEDVSAVAEEAGEVLALGRDDLLDLLEDDFGLYLVSVRALARASLRVRKRLGRAAGFARPEATARELADPRDLASRIAFLHRHSGPGRIQLSTLGTLASEMRHETHREGERLWQSGAPAQHAAIVASGVVACRTEDGRQQFELGPGSLLGGEEMLAGRSRWFEAVARTPVTLLRLERTPLLDVLEDEPELAIEALVLFARRTLALLASRSRAPLRAASTSGAAR